MSTAYHPESDGQTEIVIKTVEIYMRATVHNNPRSWIDLLPWVEHWYNTSYYHSAGMSPFEIVYGQAPPNIKSVYSWGILSRFGCSGTTKEKSNYQ